MNFDPRSRPPENGSSGEGFKAASSNVELGEGLLIAQHRILGSDPAILAQLGYTGTIPPIPPEFVAQLVSNPNLSLVLDFKPRLIDFHAKLNDSLTAAASHLSIEFSEKTDSWEFATELPSGEPEWKLVANKVDQQGAGLVLSQFLDRLGVGKEVLPDPRSLILMIGLYQVTTREQMPGFIGVATATSVQDLYIGLANREVCYVLPYCEMLADTVGSSNMGLASGVAPK